MKIGFDLDGVIVNHTVAKIKLASEFGLNIEEKDTPSEIFRSMVPKSILEEIQKSLYDTIYANSFLMKGAYETILKIKASETEYFLISRRKIPSVAIEFLEKNKLWPEYFNESNSFFVLEKEDKDVKAKALGVTHYIDDEVSVLENLKSVKSKFLFDSFELFPHSDFYTKVASWEDIKKQLRL